MKRTIRVFSLLLAAVMLLSAQALATEPAQAFTDVSKQDYFYDAVNWAVEKEITSGVSKDVFAPNRDCTARRLCDLPLEGHRKAGRELRDELF